MAILEIDGVTKIYKSKGREIVAAKNISFTVDKGEIVGFIGRNGAGKTTTIKIATGLVSATSGSVRINGFDINNDRVNALEKVGCIVETPDLYKEWSAMKNLEYFAEFGKGKGIFADKSTFRSDVKQRSEELLQFVDIYDRKDDPIKKYSLGMKQRVGIAQALINKPNLLILDEPTNGLDPAGIKEVRDLLRKISKEYDMAILVSSHLLSEVQLMCDKYVIVEKGEIVGTYTPSDLEKASTNEQVVLTTSDVVKAKDYLKEKLGIEATQTGEGKLSFSTDKAVNELAKELINGDIEVLGITRKEISLEDFFMRITGEDKQK